MNARNGSVWNARLPGESASDHRARYRAAMARQEEAKDLRDFLEDLGRAAWARMHEVGGDEGPEEYTRVTEAIRSIRAEMNAIVHGPVSL